MGNQRGQLTLDFMFAIILIFSVTALLAVLTFTLTLTEVVQYVTFSGARTYLAGDMDPGTQAQEGNLKAQTLFRQLPFLSGAQASGWIKIKPAGSRNYADYANSVGADISKHNQFTGYQVVLTMPILKLNLPLIGDLLEAPGAGVGGSGSSNFSTRVSSFLMREPSFNECKAYLNGAYTKLLTLSPRYQGAGGGNTSFVLLLDNGC